MTEQARWAESSESASPRITRAVAAALAGRPYQPFEFPAWQRLGLRFADFLPDRWVERLAAWQVVSQGLAPSAAGEVDVERLAAARLADYEAGPSLVDAMVCGSALGGAAAHLAVALGAFFLPQPFILGFRGGSEDDSAERHLARGRALAEPILRNNPDVVAISHFDPIHDGWLTRRLTHLRLKLIRLPQTYRRFINDRLRPGGALVYLDCTASWPNYQVGPRHRLQIGGWGGLAPDAYLDGSPEIDKFLQGSGSSHRGGWAVPGLELHSAPESEWGTEPGMGEALEALAVELGARFVRIRLPNPAAFSELAYRGQEALLASRGRRPAGVLVETFTQFDPAAVSDAGLLPLWLVFNTDDSLHFLERMVDRFPEETPILCSALITFSRTPDMVPWHAWEDALSGRNVLQVGARPHRYPSDVRRLVEGANLIRRWVAEHRHPVKGTLSAEELASLVPEIVSGM